MLSTKCARILKKLSTRKKYTNECLRKTQPKRTHDGIISRKEIKATRWRGEKKTCHETFAFSIIQQTTRHYKKYIYIQIYTVAPKKNNRTTFLSSHVFFSVPISSRIRWVFMRELCVDRRKYTFDVIRCFIHAKQILAINSAEIKR